MGVAPEVEDVTFELSIDGTNYTSLGEGVRISDGWEFTGLSLPAGINCWVRARGRTHGGYYTGSSGLIESIRQFYRVASPQISVATGNADPFSFTFTNPGHHGFTVLAATNLVPSIVWEPLGWPTNIGNGLYRFTDADTTSRAIRFYRLRGP